MTTNNDMLERVVSILNEDMSRGIMDLKQFDDHRKESDAAIVDAVEEWFEQKELPALHKLLSCMLKKVTQEQGIINRTDLRKRLVKIVSLNKELSKETLAEGIGQTVAQYLFEK